MPAPKNAKQDPKKGTAYVVYRVTHEENGLPVKLEAVPHSDGTDVKLVQSVEVIGGDRKAIAETVGDTPQEGNYVAVPVSSLHMRPVGMTAPKVKIG